MADMTMDTGGTTRGGAVGAGSTTFATTEPTGWVGWNVFAATILMIAGALHLIWGFVAVVNDDWVVWGNRADLYIDLSAWGWVHLAAGAVVLLAGFGVLTGNVLARIVGVAVAGVSFIANFLSLPAYPVWSLAMMTLAVLAIWAMTAHGHEMRELRDQASMRDLR